MTQEIPGEPAPASNDARKLGVESARSLSQDRDLVERGERWIAFGVAGASAGGALLLDAVVAWLTAVFSEAVKAAVPWVGLLIGALVTAVSAFVLWKGLATRRKAQDRIVGRGTLYYVRYLDHAMRDLHLDDLRKAAGGHRDVRAVTRWAPSPAGGPLLGIDVAAEVGEMAMAFQSAMNQDTNDTSFTIVPNMLWPAALRLGFDSYFFDRTVLLESDAFDPHPLNPSATPHPVVRVTTPDSARQAETQILAIELTHPVTLPAPWRSLPKTTVDMGPNTSLILNPGRQREAGPEGPALEYAELNRVTAACSKAVFDTLSSTEGPIILVARMPKVAALLMGWQLGQKMNVDLTDRQVVDMWRRLYTVEIRGFGTDTYPVVTRVHPSQEPLDTMVDHIPAIAVK